MLVNSRHFALKGYLESAVNIFSLMDRVNQKKEQAINKHDICEEIMENIVQKLSLSKQMYLFAFSCAVGQLTVLAYIWFGVSASTSLNSVGIVITIITVGTCLVVSALAYYLGEFSSKRAELVVEGLNAIAKGNLGKKMDIKGKDEFAWMCWEYTCARKGFGAMVNSISGSTSQLASAAEQISSISEQSSQGVSRQQSEVQQVATAMEEMSATVQEVANNAGNAATAAQEADTQAKHGHDVVNETVTIINSLADEVTETSNVIEKLKGDSISIGAVLDVIRDIAEQTNLLALNAAIEAARAGEQGRGFAVVADEVRTLASRTQQSTQEIQKMIERLQGGANAAVAAMEQGRSKAQESVEQAAKAGQALESITAVVDNIKAMNMQIAGAADQQSTTAEEINRNIVNISSVAEENAAGARQTSQAIDDLAHLAVEIQEHSNKFSQESFS